MGKRPLANGFLKQPGQAIHYDLDVVICPWCSLVQLSQVISPEELFSYYSYFSSNSQTMVQHAKELVDEISIGLSSSSAIYEIASNDGYLLQHVKNSKAIGVEPAKNIAEVARSKGIETLDCFFDSEFGKAHQGAADRIVALNVLGHVDNINDFVSGISYLLKTSGYAVFEVPYIRDLVDHLEWDTIYHEHLYYYSLTSLCNLFARHGMSVVKFRRIPIHGGSLRIYVQHRRYLKNPADEMLELERRLQLDRYIYYQNFAMRVEKSIAEISQALEGLRNIVAYGASAKGTMLLNAVRRSNNIMFVLDNTIAKQDLFVPGINARIISPEYLHEADFALLTAWNFAEEIIGKHKEWKGKWIIPIPTVRMI